MQFNTVELTCLTNPSTPAIRCPQGVVDPEAKRKAIGAGFIRVFDDFAKGLEKKHGIKPRFLVQVRAFCDGPFKFDV